MRVVGRDVCFDELDYVRSLYLRRGPVNFSSERMGAPVFKINP